MEKLVVLFALTCALLAVAVSGRATENTQMSVDAPTPSDALAHSHQCKVPPGAHGRSKRAATCGVQTTLSAVQAQESVLAHNNFRAKETSSNMKSMIWSDEMAAVAQSWANTCTWEHGNLYDCSGNRVGQNLFVEASIGGYPAKNMTRTIEAWSAEKKDYTFGTNQCTSGKMCGHYTQVVWANSVEVGCAATNCPKMVVSGQTWTNALFIVCDYRNPGNVVGQPIYTSGTACANCDSEGTGAGYKCVNKLCSKCSPSTDSTCKCGTPAAGCQNGGSWSATTCSCVCPKKFYGSKCEFTCTCDDLEPLDCADWSDFCQDPDYNEYMQENCKKTCQFTCTLPASCSA